MAFKIVIPENQHSITVSGLYQWDFGQTLEIECAELGSELMEVHFACSGMTEAIVRSCSFSVGIGTVTIPDKCLEQANVITAWIYSISGTQGHTVKTIILPVTARTRPSATRDVPAEHVDKYAEAITEINDAVNNLEKGNIIAAKATHAVSADSATTAQSATSASYATSAGSATTAVSADKASKVVTSLHTSCEVKSGRADVPAKFSATEIYFVVFKEGTTGFNSGIFCAPDQADGVYFSSVGLYTLKLLNSGAENADSFTLTSVGVESADINGTLYFYKIGGISG